MTARFFIDTKRFQISYWNAAIVAAAKELACVAIGRKRVFPFGLPL